MSPPLLRALRPHQWVKNLFVGAPLLFGKVLGYDDPTWRTACAMVLFCAVSGAVYLINDLYDLEADRAHPRKRLRPLASGELAVPAARIAAAVLLSAALGGAWLLDPSVGACAGAYLVLNLAYSFALKRVPFVDVLCITAGFLVRVLAGAYAALVPASGWLLLCTGLLAAFLGYGKRAHELATARDATQRAVLSRYPARWLQLVLYALGVATVVSYIAYTRAEHTRVFFGTGALVWTSPFVIFGVGRFLWLVARRPDAESPTTEMLRDQAFRINLILWVTAVTLLIYGSSSLAPATLGIRGL